MRIGRSIAHDGSRERELEDRPWVDTVSGLIVLGAEATGWRAVNRGGERGAMVLDLRPPGGWNDGWDERWFTFGRGRPWFLWDPTRLPQ